MKNTGPAKPRSQRSTQARRFAASAGICVALLGASIASGEEPPEPGETLEPVLAEQPAEPTGPLPREGARHAADLLGPIEPLLGEQPVFSVNSPIGPIEYREARGVHFGWTGLNVGGFGTFEFEKEEGEPGEVLIDGVNILALFEPLEFFRVFADVEFDGILEWDTSTSRVESPRHVGLERLFQDIRFDDALTARVGKFQTPAGRWNLVPAEPFVWTPQEPAVIEHAFNEHQTGGAAIGTFYPAGGDLKYWVYGQFFDPLDSQESDDGDHSVGARLQFDRSLGQWSLGASFLAAEESDDWAYLGGLDAQWLIGPLELTAVGTLQRGDIPQRSVTDVYLQGVLEVLPNFYLVGRYEHFDLKGLPASNIGDVGIAWTPVPFLHLKAAYRLTDEESEDVVRGLKVTLSVVF